MMLPLECTHQSCLREFRFAWIPCMWKRKWPVWWSCHALTDDRFPYSTPQVVLLGSLFLGLLLMFLLRRWSFALLSLDARPPTSWEEAQRRPSTWAEEPAGSFLGCTISWFRPRCPADDQTMPPGSWKPKVPTPTVPKMWALGLKYMCIEWCCWRFVSFSLNRFVCRRFLAWIGVQGMSCNRMLTQLVF